MKASGWEGLKYFFLLFLAVAICSEYMICYKCNDVAYLEHIKILRISPFFVGKLGTFLNLFFF